MSACPPGVSRAHGHRQGEILLLWVENAGLGSGGEHTTFGSCWIGQVLSVSCVLNSEIKPGVSVMFNDKVSKWPLLVL